MNSSVVMHRKEQQLQYWHEFRNYLAIRGSRIKTPKPHCTTPNELMIAIGRIDVRLRAFMKIDDFVLTVCLYLTGEEKRKRFDVLMGIRQQIEDELCYDLDWFAGGGDRAAYVATHKPKTDPTDESDWSDQFEWFRRAIECFDDVFRSKVATI